MAEFNFAQLRESNALLWKWGQHLKIQNGVFLRFVYKIKENKEEILSQLKTKKLKKEFLKDFEKMFYAEEVENALILQYRPMIYSVIRRFAIKNAEIGQTAFDVGICALRGSIWRYRMDTVKFITFAMNGVICAVRGTVHHESLVMKQEQERFKRILFNEETHETFIGDDNLACKRFKEPSENITNRSAITEENLQTVAKLTDDEKVIIDMHLDGQGYREKFKTYYKKKYGIIPNKSKMNTIWKNSQIKIWAAVISQHGVDAVANLKSPVTTHMTLRQKKILNKAMAGAINEGNAVTKKEGA
jgi:5S rRNA maturation endonuclease (ribonuclease M5)